MSNSTKTLYKYEVKPGFHIIVQIVPVAPINSKYFLILAILRRLGDNEEGGESTDFRLDRLFRKELGINHTLVQELRLHSCVW